MSEKERQRRCHGATEGERDLCVKACESVCATRALLNMSGEGEDGCRDGETYNFARADQCLAAYQDPACGDEPTNCTDFCERQ